MLIIIPITIAPCIIWLLPIRYGPDDYRYNKIAKPDKIALNWLYKKAEHGDRGIGPTSAEARFQLINIAGVYGVNPDPDTTFQMETINTALSTLNPCLLKELKTDWLYLDKDLLFKLARDVEDRKNVSNKGAYFMRLLQKKNTGFEV